MKFTDREVNLEKEWTDFYFTLEDPKNLERINTRHVDDVSRIVGHYPVDVYAPVPVAGKENLLRIRTYESFKTAA